LKKGLCSIVQVFLVFAMIKDWRKMSLLLSLVLSTYVCAQDVMPKDESGFFTYYDIVELPGYPSEILLKNAKDFLKEFSVRGSKKKYFEFDKQALKVINKGSYKVSNMWGLGKHTDGIVMFDMNVEIKEGRYRYIITNFVFQEFKRNRYGKHEPVKGSEKPLEIEVSKLSKPQWEKHQQHTHEKIQSLIMDFKVAMASVEDKKEKNKRKKIDDDW
jgi:hypothetical protein